MLNKIILHKHRSYSCIEIRSNDKNYDDVMIYFVRILCDAAQGKKVFIAYNGSFEPEEKHLLIAQQKDVKNHFKQKVWMQNDWLRIARNVFDEEEYFNIYLFDDKYEWNAFLCENRSNDSYMLKEPRLYLLASFGQCQPHLLYIRRDNTISEQVIKYFISQGYDYTSPLL